MCSLSGKGARIGLGGWWVEVGGRIEWGGVHYELEQPQAAGLPATG